MVDFSSITDCNRFVNWLCCDQGLRDPLCSRGTGHLGKGHCLSHLQSGWVYLSYGMVAFQTEVNYKQVFGSGMEFCVSCSY